MIFVFKFLLHYVANELAYMRIYFVRSDDGDRSRLPDNISDLDLVKVWHREGHAESLYVLPAWYVITDRSSRRLHAIDPPVYRRLATAAANKLAERWRQTMLKSGGGLRRSIRDVVESTTIGIQLSQLFTPRERVLPMT